MDRRIAVTSKTKSEDEFDAETDRYFGILDEMSTLLIKHDLAIDEALIILDAMSTSLTEYKLRTYETVKQVIRSHK